MPPRCYLKGFKRHRSRLGPGLLDGDRTQICCPPLFFTHQRESPSKIPLCGPILPSGSSARSLLVREGLPIWVAGGLPILSGTACLPPSGLLKNLKYSWKLERALEDSVHPVHVPKGRLNPPAGMACASPGAEPGQEVAWLALGKEPRLWRSPQPQGSSAAVGVMTPPA